MVFYIYLHNMNRVLDLQITAF